MAQTDKSKTILPIVTFALDIYEMVLSTSLVDLYTLPVLDRASIPLKVS